MSDIIEQREAWAESEARSFDKTAEAIEKSGEQWRTRTPNGAESCHMAVICFLKAQAWREAARSLRQPKAIRLELEEAQPHD